MYNLYVYCVCMQENKILERLANAVQHALCDRTQCPITIPMFIFFPLLNVSFFYDCNFIFCFARRTTKMQCRTNGHKTTIQATKHLTFLRIFQRNEKKCHQCARTHTKARIVKLFSFFSFALYKRVQ